MTTLTLGLVGNPNCGKSTIFNELTGASQKVGNWPGVTVECKSGYFIEGQKKVSVVDLPGIYQLAASDNQQAVDEKIACEYILSQKADVIINIIDATHLERHLYLTLQLLDMKVPLIVAVNMLDIAKQRQIKLNLQRLQTLLGCPVVGLIANKGDGIAQLKKEIICYGTKKNRNTNLINYPDKLHQAISLLELQIKLFQPNQTSSNYWLAQQLLQDPESIQCIDHEIKKLASECKISLEQEFQEELDIIFADKLYSTAHQIYQEVSSLIADQKTITERIDSIVLNRWLGIPIFLSVIYAMFLFAINLGGAFQDLFDISSDVIFVQSVAYILTQLHSPNWLIALLAAGFGKGINTTISFIPVIGAMFLFLAFLEGSGYMARASFVVDRLMRVLGLPGKSFVPMIVGFGCNVPAILAARTLETKRDRTLTILMSPFMSCGARLAIFAIFTAAFFPAGGQNIVFALYFIGIIAAVLTGFVLRKTLLQGEATPLILELPAYHLPSFPSLIKQTWQRLKSFIFRAGKLIIPICMLIGLSNAINIDGTLNSTEGSANSVLSCIGRMVTPLLRPMGIRDDNWPATVGLVTGVLAKEVVVATLNTLYSQDGHLALKTDEKFSLTTGLRQAIFSVPHNLWALKNSLTNPVLACAPEHKLDHTVYGIMYQRFGSQAAAFAYLLFVLLYFPCISATAVMAKELNKGWSLFSVAWSTGIAYAIATSFYQLATFRLHPKQSLIWVAMTVAALCYVLSVMKRYSYRHELRIERYVVN